MAQKIQIKFSGDSQAMNNSRALLYAAICVLLWSFIAVAARLGQNKLDHYQFLFFSNILSSFSVFALAFATGKTTKSLLVVPWETVWQCALLGLLDCLFYLLLYYGYTVENGVAVLVAQYSWPLLIVVLSVLIFRGRLYFQQTLGMLLGFIAVGVTLTQGSISRIAVTHPQALALVFAGAFCFALLSVLSKKFSINGYTGALWIFLFSSLASAILMLLLSDFKWPTKDSLVVLLLNGVLINGVSYVLWIKAMASGDASKVASLVFLSPILSIIWLILIFDEPFVPAYALGVGLAVASGLLCTRTKKVAKK